MIARVASQVVHRWERFWFDRIPLESYALLRMAFGALALIEVLSLTPVSMFWTLDGLTPLPGGGLGLRSLLLEYELGAAAGWLLFVALVVALTAVTVGYRTHIALPIAFVGSLVHQRLWNPLPLSSANAVTLIVLFYLLWTDCSGKPSVDHVFRRRRGIHQGIDSSVPVSVWPLQLIRIHVALVYFTTGFWKLANSAWRDGSALHDVLNLNTFARFPYPAGDGLAGLLMVGTYMTLLWELTFPLMLFNRWTRRLTLMLGVILHVGMWATMEIGVFSFVMIATYVAFLDPATMHEKLRGRSYSFRDRVIKV